MPMMLQRLNRMPPEPPSEFPDGMAIDPRMLRDMTQGRINSPAARGFEFDPREMQDHVGTPGIPVTKMEQIGFGIGPIPYSPPRTLNNDPMVITPRELRDRTHGRINAPSAAPAIQTPDEYSAHVGVVGRPQIKPTRINYDLPPHPDTTTAQRLGRMLMMQQSY